jgi:hypothetical protein
VFRGDIYKDGWGIDKGDVDVGADDDIGIGVATYGACGEQNTPISDDSDVDEGSKISEEITCRVIVFVHGCRPFLPK